MANKKYTEKFKLDAAKPALSSDKSQTQVASDLSLNDNQLYNWVSQYRGDVLHYAHNLSPEQELKALKK